MTWIDDDYEELKRRQRLAAELHSQESEIAGHASKIYEDLWAELVERINEAKTKRVTESSLLTNGSSYQRKVIVGTNKSLHPDAYHLDLAESKQSINFKGPDVSVILPLALCEDGVVRIRYDGKCQTVPEAAQYLLRPLIFPEMFGPK
jgi:hypothetical protein